MKRGAVVLALALAACGGGELDAQEGEAQDAVMQVPQGFPTPRVPKDNPMSVAKVSLGRHLFYDKRLSLNDGESCASCHHQNKAFTDGSARSFGTTGDLTPRSAMSLVNVAYVNSLTWGNPVVVSLEQQATLPMFGENPVELGLAGKEAELFQKLRAEPRYVTLFPEAFPGEADPFTVPNVTRAIAAFERTILSADSPYDRYTRGDAAAIGDAAKRGEALFFSERLECFHCHQGFLFSDSSTFVGKAIEERPFHNTGLYNLDGKGAYPEPNRGVYEVTKQPGDMGRFRAPTLRNVAVTAPYMHDGSIATLRDVIAHYAAGGRTITDGPNAGVGSASPLKSEFMVGFQISPAEVDDLIAFLESLTDESVLSDPRFSDPWNGN